MDKKTFPSKAWAIVSKGHRGNTIISWSIRYTRTYAISEFIKEFNGNYTWDELQKKGFDVAKVNIEAT